MKKLKIVPIEYWTETVTKYLLISNRYAPTEVNRKSRRSFYIKIEFIDPEQLQMDIIYLAKTILKMKKLFEPTNKIKTHINKCYTILFTLLQYQSRYFTTYIKYVDVRNNPRAWHKYKTKYDKLINKTRDRYEYTTRSIQKFIRLEVNKRTYDDVDVTIITREIDETLVYLLYMYRKKYCNKLVNHIAILLKLRAVKKHIVKCGRKTKWSPDRDNSYLSK